MEKIGSAPYDNSIMLLPQNLRGEARKLIGSDRARAEELRLRVGQRMSVLMPEGELILGSTPVTGRDLDSVLEIATNASAHASQESVRAGYITVSGGCRIGLCGTAVLRDGEIFTFRRLSSVAIRIPREMTGVSEAVFSRLISGGRFRSTLIVSPPGGGKTTLLRDLIRKLATPDPGAGFRGLRVCVADERGEISGMYNGRPGFNLGNTVDIVESCPKAEGILLLLRAMNPQVVALDEITAPEDVSAVLSAAGCGVGVLATAHGENAEDLAKRKIYRDLLREGLFECVVTVGRSGQNRTYTVEELR